MDGFWIKLIICYFLYVCQFFIVYFSILPLSALLLMQSDNNNNDHNYNGRSSNDYNNNDNNSLTIV